MGTMTEVFRYHNAHPVLLNDTKKSFSHISVSPELKGSRSQNKFYRKYFEEYEEYEGKSIL